MPKLTDLLADETVDTDALAAGLKGLVAIASDGSLRPLDNWDRLSQKSKVLATLLGLKAAKLLGKRESDAATPSEITRISGVPAGTTKRELREFHKARVVSVGAKGAYFIAAEQIRRVLSAVSSEVPRG